MIEKCPHCKRDVVFSRDICPACGFSATDKEREQATYMGESARQGLAPAYIEEMESRLNATQSRGRLQTGLVIGLLLAPLVVLNVVGLVWLNVVFWALAALAGAAWLGWKLWWGSNLARHALWILAAGSGAVGLFLCMTRPGLLNPVELLGYLIFGGVYIWCAWILLTSRDVPQWLRYQRHQRAERGDG